MLFMLVCKHLFEFLPSILYVIYLEVEFMDQMIILSFEETPNSFSP